MTPARSRNLRRRRGSQDPLARLVVVTEGKLTEPRYLRKFAELHPNPSLRMEPIGDGGDPRAVVEKAIQEVQKARTERLGSRDVIWAMFDRDDHPRFHEAMNMARGNDIPVALSNPCFELWAIYHYQDCDAPLEPERCQDMLGELCSSYDRKRRKIFDDREAIGEKYRNAVERAESSLNNRTSEGDSGGNPSTTVHRLTEQFCQF